MEKLRTKYEYDMDSLSYIDDNKTTILKTKTIEVEINENLRKGYEEICVITYKRVVKPEFEKEVYNYYDNDIKSDWLMY